MLEAVVVGRGLLSLQTDLDSPGILKRMSTTSEDWQTSLLLDDSKF